MKKPTSKSYYIRLINSLIKENGILNDRIAEIESHYQKKVDSLMKKIETLENRNSELEEKIENESYNRKVLESLSKENKELRDKKPISFEINEGDKIGFCPQHMFNILLKLNDGYTHFKDVIGDLNMLGKQNNLLSFTITIRFPNELRFLLEKSTHTNLLVETTPWVASVTITKPIDIVSCVVPGFTEKAKCFVISCGDLMFKYNGDKALHSQFYTLSQELQELSDSENIFIYSLHETHLEIYTVDKSVVNISVNVLIPMYKITEDKDKTFMYMRLKYNLTEYCPLFLNKHLQPKDKNTLYIDYISKDNKVLEDEGHHHIEILPN